MPAFILFGFSSPELPFFITCILFLLFNNFSFSFFDFINLNSKALDELLFLFEK